ncbi:MAG: Txe/YoeB family addiction module toxin [Bacteroidales bacterium]|nr:Txe/YoeB family addiction module toxin [Bacteroidales bacterium]
MYKIKFSKTAIDDIVKLRRNEPNAYKKLDGLISELKEHPTTGTGHPEQLKGDKVGKWSRHITSKHRLIYEIKEDVVILNVLAAYGHYGDK